MAWPFRVTDPLLDVLEILLDADADLHGWAIMKQTQRSGPTIYQVLERLRKARWVDCWWEDQEGGLASEPDRVAGAGDRGNIARDRENVPRRRYYRLSDEGAARAPVLLAERGRSRQAGAPRATRVPGLATFGRRRWLLPGGAQP
jgi:PadR family transcriptional regulator, regulatory protein PadR